MTQARWTIEDASRPTGRGEAVRAFVLFGSLLLLLVAIAGRIALGDLSRIVLYQRLDLGRDEARQIAAAVDSLGADQGAMDFHRLEQRLDVLDSLVRERLAKNPFVRHVEVRDRFGARLLFVDANGGEGTGSPQDWPASGEHVVAAPLGSGKDPGGEVVVGISDDATQRELDSLRRSLLIKVSVAAAFGVGLLVLSFFYVLHLIRRNRGLEQERQAANRRAQVAMLGSGLAHEIRNPLNAMNLNLEMLEEELQALPGIRSGDDTMELLGSIKGEIKRLEHLVNSFLVYSRPSALRFEVRDLNGILNEVARFLQADFRQSGIELVVDLEPLLPTVEVDETQIKQALMNLLVNARQVLGPGGRVALRSRAGASGDVVVEVQDDGPGIPAAVRDRIFDVFYSNRGGGTGLGLPIALQIVKGHGGAIEVETAEGKGTTFRIRLPRRQTRAALAAPAAG
jgi:signal transduction histidine kinase